VQKLLSRFNNQSSSNNCPPQNQSQLTVGVSIIEGGAPGGGDSMNQSLAQTDENIINEIGSTPKFQPISYSGIEKHTFE
jgi:hypothetical protein